MKLYTGCRAKIDFNIRTHQPTPHWVDALSGSPTGLYSIVVESCSHGSENHPTHRSWRLGNSLCLSSLERVTLCHALKITQSGQYLLRGMPHCTMRRFPILSIDWRLVSPQYITGSDSDGMESLPPPLVAEPGAKRLHAILELSHSRGDLLTTVTL